MKKSFVVIAALLCLVTHTFHVFATSAGPYSSPASTAGSWSSKTPSWPVTSSATTATGANTYCYFSGFTAWAGSFESNNNRKITIQMFETDFTSDVVKEYTGTFSGRTMSSVTLKRTVISGNIENSADATAELGIKYKVDKMTSDPATPSIASGLFKYTVGIN